MRLIPSLAICATAALSACATTTTGPATPTIFAQMPASNPSAGPGPEEPTPAIAGETFGKACLAAQPTYQNTPTALARLGFVQNTSTAAYHSARYNMTVKLVDRPNNIECSVIFAGDDSDREALGRAFGEAAAANGNGNSVDVGLRFQPFGNFTYINARIVSPK